MEIHGIRPGQFVSYDFTESMTIVVSRITCALEKIDPQIR
jgi:hypothetical protein